MISLPFDDIKLIKLLDGTSVPRYVIKKMKAAIQKVQDDKANNMLPVLALDELAMWAAEPRREVTTGYQMYLEHFGLWPLDPQEQAVLRNALIGEGSEVRWVSPVYTEGPTFRANIVGLPSPIKRVLPPSMLATMHRRPTRRKKRRR